MKIITSKQVNKQIIIRKTHKKLQLKEILAFLTYFLVFTLKKTDKRVTKNLFKINEKENR